MFPSTALCLALTLSAAPVLAAKPPAKARPPAKSAPATALAADATVPAPGACGERIMPATGRGRAVGSFLERRTDFQATLLPGGRVLVTGGTLQTPSSEWFDPGTNRFSPGPALTRPRQGHRALLLKDGRVLVLGGTEAPSPAEVLEPGATAFKAVPEATFALCAEAVELDEGRVLLVDGASGTVYVWDGRRAPSSKGTLARPRNFFRAVRLKDGRVAITGGWPADPVAGKGRRGRPSTGSQPSRATGESPVLPVECFNPRWASLSTWSQVPVARARHQATILADGRLCLWGGVGQDPDQPVTELEVLDPAKESVTRVAKLDLQVGASPAWAVDAAGQGLYLPERGQRLLTCKDPLTLAEAKAGSRLANGYLGPTLVPLADGSILVLGTPAFGAPMDRWDARTRQCTVVGTLRAGADELGLLPDGQVLALGPVVDRLDPRTGAMTPLGWREDLEALLGKLKPAVPAPGAPPFAPGLTRQDALVVSLDKTRALVVGGTGPDGPSGAVDLWDLKKRTLTPTGPVKTRRPKPEGLRLTDGSVLIWGPGKD